MENLFLKKSFMELILKYFDNPTENQQVQFRQMQELYQDWNLKINLVSRKDIDELYLRHVLHSLAIAKVQPFLPSAKILDVGTGGGFPGIPLAVMFPETHFHLVDSIGKKIKVVEEVVQGLKLQNIKTTHGRVETLSGSYDFIVSRAVAPMETLVHWAKGLIAKKNRHELKNGMLCLKGGDLSEELKLYKTATVFPIGDFFSEAFFDTKSVVHFPLKYKG